MLKRLFKATQEILSGKYHHYVNKIISSSNHRFDSRSGYAHPQFCWEDERSKSGISYKEKHEIINIYAQTTL